MSFIGLGIAIGNVAGAVSASVGTALGIGALGSTAVGAGGIGSLLGATAAGTAGSALAGTSGTLLGEAATALGIGGVESAAAPTAASVAGGGAPQSVAGLFPSGTQGAASTVQSAGLTSGGAPVSGAVPAGPTSGITSTGISAPGGSVAAPTAAPSTTLTSGGLTGGGHLGDTVATNAFSKGVEGVNQQIANAQTERGAKALQNQQAADETQGTRAANNLYSGNWSMNNSWTPGKAEGGIVAIKAARGGSVPLKNGDYIVPADVVSALGNGSSKAGAKYLTHLVNALNAGPPPKAGSLAKQRAKERHTA